VDNSTLWNGPLTINRGEPYHALHNTMLLTQCCLGNSTHFIFLVNGALGAERAGYNVARVIESLQDAGDVGAREWMFQLHRSVVEEHKYRETLEKTSKEVCSFPKRDANLLHSYKMPLTSRRS
jgi:hypothetical protein